MIRLRPASTADLQALAADQATEDLSYAPAGLVAAPSTPDGFRRHRWGRRVDGGHEAFARMAEALRTWEMQRRAGLTVVADGPVAPGRIVAMSAPVLFVHVDVACRVLDVIEGDGHWGFVYGTLPVHPETGEERFSVARHGERHVDVEIEAVSRPAHPLSRLAPPINRRLQDRAVRGYLDAMEQIAAGR